MNVRTNCKIFNNDFRDIINNISYDFIITDPPYNMNHKYVDFKDKFTEGKNEDKWLRHIWDEARSKAKEDAAMRIEELQKEIEKNFSSRLNVYNIGIGNKNSNLELNYSTEKSELASFIQDLDKLSFIDSKNNKKIIVEVMTLDSFFKKNEQTYKEKEIDLLKIDTEGFELEVLNGASETLINKKPKFIQIVFNWHQLFREQTIFKFSKILSNYEVFKILPFGNSLIKIDPKRPESNIFHLSNFVFIRKDISKNY